jgi:hypothetical protein
MLQKGTFFLLASDWLSPRKIEKSKKLSRRELEREFT